MSYRVLTWAFRWRLHARDKAEAAYRRGNLLEKRRRLMDDWAAFCDRLTPPAGQVVQLRAAAL